MSDYEKRGRGKAPDVDGMITLKVDNITYRTSKEDLEREFGKYGEVGDVYIPRVMGSSEPRGFAFVRYLNRSDAEDAMRAMDGVELESGRPLRVQEAKNKRPDNPKEYYDSRRRERSNYRDRDRYRDSYRGRDRDRDRDYDDRRGRERSLSRNRRRRSSRSRSYDRDSRRKDRDNSRARDRSTSRERSNDRGTNRDRERDRGRDREDDRSRDRDRDNNTSREKSHSDRDE